MKPPAGTAINYGHPLLPDRGLYLFNEGAGLVARDSLGRHHLTVNSACVWTPTGIDLSAATACMTLDNSAKLFGYEFTVIWGFNGRGTPAVYGRFLESSLGPVYIIERENGDSNIGHYYSGGSTQYLSGVTLWGTGPHQISVSLSDEKNYRRGMVDGHGFSGYFSPNAITITSPQSGALYVGNSIGLNRTCGGEFQYIYVWSRYLSDSEIQVLYHNPYCFVAPPVM